MSIDIVFCTVPFTDTVQPLMAPAILKSVAKSAGRTSRTIDLNYQYRDRILKSPQASAMLAWFKDGILQAEVEQDIFHMFHDMAGRILAMDPACVGISVFTYDCQQAATYLSWMLKKLRPDIKILLGGSGLVVNLCEEVTLGERLMQQGVIDYYIKGDGEKPLYEYLKYGIRSGGFNSPVVWQQMTNREISQLPIPDYDDYDIDSYQNRRLPILGSRGCVRACTFCDVHTHWTKFTWRTGEDIFREMIALSERYKIYDFQFGDSLINGNQREFRRLIQLLADHNSSAEQPITWRSFFIIRPINNLSESDWELTSRSGGQDLSAGVESLNPDVRRELGKEFNNADLEFALRMAKKYQIQIRLLFLIGYITETEQDIQNAIQWWRDHAEFRDVVTVNLGTPLGILKDTELERNFEKLGLRWVGPNQTDWANENSDPKMRVRWYEQLSAAIREVGFREIKGFDNYYIMERIKKNGDL
jgi:radical SAM superfamily enzyme YgiQ (UPF0313 family)